MVTTRIGNHVGKHPIPQVRRKNNVSDNTEGELMKLVWITAVAATSVGFLVGFAAGAGVMAARLGEGPMIDSRPA